MLPLSSPFNQQPALAPPARADFRKLRYQVTVPWSCRTLVALAANGVLYIATHTHLFAIEGKSGE